MLQTRVVLISLNVAAFSFFIMMPGLVGAMVDHLSFSDAQAGWVATVHMFGFFAVTLGASLSIHRWNLKRSILLGLLLLLSADGTCAVMKSYSTWIGLRLAGGIGSGLIWCSIAAYVAKFKDPDPFFGMLWCAQFTLGAIGLYTLPHLLQGINLQGVFCCIATLSLLGLIALVWLPGSARSADQNLAGSQPLTRLMTLPIIMVFFAYILMAAGEAGLWTYWDRVGTSAGIPVEKVGLSLSLSQIGGMLGGLLAAWIGTRFGRTIPVSIGLSLIMASLAAVIIDITMVTFTSAAFFFTSAISFVSCYYMGITAEADPSGRLVATANVMFSLGMFVGPGLASLVVGHGYSTLLWIMLGHFALSLVLVLPATRVQKTVPRHDAPLTT